MELLQIQVQSPWTKLDLVVLHLVLQLPVRVFEAWFEHTVSVLHLEPENSTFKSKTGEVIGFDPNPVRISLRSDPAASAPTRSGGISTITLPGMLTKFHKTL